MNLTKIFFFDESLDFFKEHDAGVRMNAGGCMNAGVRMNAGGCMDAGGCLNAGGSMDPCSYKIFSVHENALQMFWRECF